MGMSVTSERVAAFKQTWGADRERLTSTFRRVRLRVAANGHVHRYQNVQEDGHLSVWCPSLAFAPSAQPKKG